VGFFHGFANSLKRLGQVERGDFFQPAQDFVAVAGPRRANRQPISSGGELCEVASGPTRSVNTPAAAGIGSELQRLALLFFRRQDERYGQLDKVSYSEHSFRVRVHRDWALRPFAEQRLADLLAIQVCRERGTKQDLLSAIGFDRRGAMELDRAACGVENQVTANQPELFVLEYGQESQVARRRPLGTSHSLFPCVAATSQMHASKLVGANDSVSPAQALNRALGACDFSDGTGDQVAS